MQIPTQAGQICKILTPLEDEDPADVYIITEDPSTFDSDDDIYVVNLRDLQRNINEPAASPHIPVIKSKLTVVAENLEEYVRTWNN